tara:strand:+ start:2918 stop:3358 length:441 start_codon:yes stop_codon:yes gene_type:complete
MRVNIQYTVEVEQIPEEMKHLLEYSVVRQLREAADRAHRMDTTASYQVLLSEIESVRELLLKSDERLSDIEGIMRGYHAQQTSEIYPEAEPVPVPTGVDPPRSPVDESSMGTIKARLAEHKMETDALKRTFQNWGIDTDSDDDGEG